MAAIKPWDMQEYDTPKSFEAFIVYRDMKKVSVDGIVEENRTLAKVAEALGKSDKLIERWSAKYNWSERVREYDAEKDREAQEQRRMQQIADIREMRRRHATVAKSMILKAAKALASIPVDEIKASDIGKMVDVASKLERISLGDVGEVIEERQGESAAAPVQFYMPSNGRDEEETD